MKNALVTFATALAVLLVACGPAATPPGGGGATAQPTALPALGSVTARMEGDWAHLDFLGRFPGGGLQTGLLLDSLYDSLVTMGPDPKDPTRMALLPYLATKWDQTADKIVFTMRNDATCSDGSKVTPSLMKRTVDLRLQSKLASPASTFGAGPYTTAADDAAGTFTINYGTPFSDAIYAFVSLKLACPQALANPDMLQNAAAGSGPYTIVEAIHGDRVTMKRRDDWKWGPNGITAKDIPEQITYKVVTNETTTANLLLTGGLDIGKVGGVDVPRLLNEKSLISKSVTSTANYDIVFNQAPGHPTQDIKVREALVSAIDLNAWNQAANQGRGVLSPSYLMQVADCFDPTTEQLRVKDPSPEKARQILTAAGWTAGPGGKLQKDGKPLSIVVVSMTVPGLGNGGEYIASQWDKAGVTVDLRVSDFNTFLQRSSKGDFDVTTTVFPYDQPNPNQGIGVLMAITDTSWSKAAPPDGLAAFQAAERAVGAERCRQWAIVQQSLLRNWALLPTASPNIYWFSKGIDFFPGASRSDVRYFRRAKA